MKLSGVINVNKPPGITSRRVVDRVLRFVRPAKCGHAGTLDPLATGVLVVCVGQATRLIGYVQQMPKTYVGTFRLGCESNTEDIEGEVRYLDNPPRPTRAEIEQQAARMIGEIEQRPPIFSALKIQGRPAYKDARAGKPVELQPRKIHVHSLQVTRYEYPELELRIECGSGTYVRSLGRDLAEALGTGAIMTALERRAIGAFHVEDAVELDALTAENLFDHLQPATRAVAQLPQVTVNEVDLPRLANGRPIEISADCFTDQATEELAALNAAGELVALLRPESPGVWRPFRTFFGA